MNDFTQLLFQLFFFYLFAVNLVCFILFGLDKLKAIRSSRRIPERILLLWAFLGGSAGGCLGMAIFRHKIRKPKFYITLPLLFVLHSAVILYLI